MTHSSQASFCQECFPKVSLVVDPYIPPTQNGETPDLDSLCSGMYVLKRIQLSTLLWGQPAAPPFFFAATVLRVKWAQSVSYKASVPTEAPLSKHHIPQEHLASAKVPHFHLCPLPPSNISSSLHLSTIPSLGWTPD
uniref:Uncharacterized protein n=1 Tax=Molossus molossus TaxID=27622 RepID=A0A7J8JWA1_MOLMO|nr:hypothetical protein HJG59_007806 [Molossus molossus]